MMNFKKLLKEVEKKGACKQLGGCKTARSKMPTFTDGRNLNKHLAPILAKAMKKGKKKVGQKKRVGFAMPTARVLKRPSRIGLSQFHFG